MPEYTSVRNLNINDLIDYFNKSPNSQNDNERYKKFIVYLLLFEDFTIDDLKKIKIGSINKSKINFILKEFFNSSAMDWEEFNTIRNRNP